MFTLSHLRSYCEQNDIPLISQATENFLWEILQKLKPKICLEIGGAVGYSAIFTANTVAQRWGQVFSFEISYPGYVGWLKHIRQSWLWNITSYPWDVRSVPIKKLLPKKMDFIFIDGQKSQYTEYMEIVENLTTDTTLIVLDDVIKYHNKLDTLYGFLEKKQIDYKVHPLEDDDGIMVIE